MKNSLKSNSNPNYISNPFKLIFKGFGNLFNINQSAAIVILVVGLFSYTGNIFPGSGNSQSPGTINAESISNDALVIIGVIVFFVMLVLVPIIIFVTTIYQGFSAYVALQTSKNKTVSIGDALRVVIKKFWTLLLINIIVFFKVLGGLLLFIIPGIRAALRYKMVHFHVFDTNSNAKESITKAKVLTKDHLIEVLGMSFAAGIIPLVNGVMDVGGQSVMYKQLNDLKSSSQNKPPVHWLNYLVFIIVGVIVLLAVLIAIAVGLSRN